MTRVRFLHPDGSPAADAEAQGVRLLELAQRLGLPLEGTCEGAMACSTCHVLIAETDLAKLPPPGPHEEDMLDFTAHVGPRSRLSCQVWLEPGLDTLEVHLPPGHADMRGR